MFGRGFDSRHLHFKLSVSDTKSQNLDFTGFWLFTCASMWHYLTTTLNSFLNSFFKSTQKSPPLRKVMGLRWCRPLACFLNPSVSPSLISIGCKNKEHLRIVASLQCDYDILSVLFFALAYFSKSYFFVSLIISEISSISNALAILSICWR